MRLLCLALLLALCACSKARQPEPEASAKPSAAPPSAQLRYGGDTAAWLGPLGDMQDQAYCAARLKLPLASKPAWELGYTSAEFSAFAPSPILHYDGTLAVCARSPQLMLLDADSGRIIANKDVYERRGGENALEALETIFVSPSGRLLACDVSNAFYCFDLRELNRVWYRGTSPRSNEGGAPLVVDGTSLYTSWGEARNWNLHALDVETGEIGWGYPSTFEPEGQGVTLSQSGILLGYAFPSQLRALRASDGQPLWTVHERAQVALAPIDEQRQQLYAVLHDESLVCRDLATGALRWRYSWAGLLSDTEREDLMVLSGLRALTRRRLEVQVNALCVTGNGVYASLQTGEVFHLGPNGKRRWQVRLDAQAVSLLAFDNALLAVQQYQIPDVQDPNSDGELGQASPPDQFNLTRPDWPNLQPAKGVRKAVFSRVVALSLTDGAILSTVDTDVASLSNLCPAGVRLVFGGVRRGERVQAAAHYITAYDWVEQ